MADSGNWRVGEPTLTTSLRGLAVVDVEVRTLRAPVHSGLFGGACADVLLALARMPAMLHDDLDESRQGLVRQQDGDGRPVDGDLRQGRGGAGRRGAGRSGRSRSALHTRARPSPPSGSTRLWLTAYLLNALVAGARARAERAPGPRAGPRLPRSR